MRREEIEGYLDSLRGSGNLRELHDVAPQGKHITLNGRKYLNLSSNDYLGLTDDSTYTQLGPGGKYLQQEFFEAIGDRPSFMMSNPSSRLMSGNIPEYEKLETAIADLFGGNRKALVLNTGYTCNSGALPALTGKGDLLLADHSSHASLMDGLRLCQAKFLRFRHNDMNHLESILAKERDNHKNVWIVTESVFSMDGDRAPLRDIVGLKHKYGLQIFLDEAHSFGLWGNKGAGLADELGVADDMDVIVAPLGKALASSGGFIITDEKTRELLVNRMRTLIFATAMPAINLLWSHFLISRMACFEPRRRHLRQLCTRLTGTEESTQIIPIITGDSKTALSMSEKFRDGGFWTTAIRHPTVAKGSERVRISLSSSITDEEIDRFKQLCENLKTTMPYER